MSLIIYLFTYLSAFFFFFFHVETHTWHHKIYFFKLLIPRWYLFGSISEDKLNEIFEASKTGNYAYSPVRKGSYILKIKKKNQTLRAHLLPCWMFSSKISPNSKVISWCSFKREGLFNNSIKISLNNYLIQQTNICMERKVVTSDNFYTKGK